MSFFTPPEEAQFVFGPYAAHLHRAALGATETVADDELVTTDEPADDDHPEALAS